MHDTLQETSDERVAVLLRALGDDVAGPILDALPDERADGIRQTMGTLEEDPDPEYLEEVLVEFERFLRFAFRPESAENRDSPELKLADTGEDATGEDGSAAEESAAQEEPPPVVRKPFVPTGDPVKDLNQLRPYQVARALEQEHPRTAALVMNKLEADTAAAVLPMLPDETRADVFLQMNRSDSSPDVLVERIIRTTVVNALSFEEPEGETLDADARAAALLRSLAKGARKEMLDALQQQDAEMAERVRSLLYEFNDILRIEPRSVQKLLGEFDIDTLCTALQGAGEELVEKVTSNLSKRARDRLMEEMELAAPDPEAIEAARKQVTEAMGRLDQTGELRMMG